MTRPIPKDILKEYLADPFSQQCCFCGSDHPQLHHNLIFGGRQVNEPWTFLPLCKACHEQVNNIDYRRLADWAMLNRATSADLQKYSTVMNYKARLSWLNSLYGDFSQRNLRGHYENLRTNN